jgi:hypothetical protein
MICAARLCDGGLGGLASDKAYNRAVKKRSELKCSAFEY